MIHNATIDYNKQGSERMIDLYYIEDPKTIIGAKQNEETASINREWKNSLSTEQRKFILDMFSVPNTIPITPHLLGIYSLSVNNDKIYHWYLLKTNIYISYRVANTTGDKLRLAQSSKKTIFFHPPKFLKFQIL